MFITFFIGNKLIDLRYSVFLLSFSKSVLIAIIIAGCLCVIKYVFNLTSLIILCSFAVIGFGLLLLLFKEIWFDRYTLKIGVLQ